jgi:hypothetical protein
MQSHEANMSTKLSRKIKYEERSERTEHTT